MRRLTPETAPARPLLLDYLLLLAGFGLSLLLCRMASLRVEMDESAVPALLRDFLPLLPDLLRLPEGVILLWPVFHFGQKLVGRRQALTSAEWLWVFAWFGTVAVNGLAAWKQWGAMPDLVASHTTWPPVIWYAILVPSLAILALFLALVGLLRWGVPPWTHNLALALLLWPIAPLVAILTLGRFV
jgi:hypothetical protein